MGNKVYEVPVELNDRQQEQMAGLEALYRLRLNYTDDEDTQCCESVNGKIRYVDYPTSFLMSLMRANIVLPDGFSFDSEVKSERAVHCGALFKKGRKEEVLSVFRAYPSLIFEGEEGLLADLQMVEEPKALSAILDGCYWLYQLERDRETGDVPTRNPAPTKAAPDKEPETLVAVRDASGVVREVTLDEAEEMREAAQGIYEGQSPEPTEESETVSNAEEELSAVRRGPLMDDKSDLYFYLLEGRNVV